MIPDNQLTTIAEKAIHGYGALQDEWELAMLLHMARQHHPTTMLEIGSYTGGSLYAWKMALPYCRIHAVTIGDNASFHSWGASMIFGDSTDPEVQARVWDKVGDGVDFVFVDGGHDEPTAYSDVEFAFKLTAQSHGLIGIHDINLFYRYPELTGPRHAWNAWRGRRYPHLEIGNVVVEDPGTGLIWNR